MLSAWASRPLSRLAIGACVLFWIFHSFSLRGGGYGVDRFKTLVSNYTATLSIPGHVADEQQLPISYNLDVPPEAGCEKLVDDLRLQLITTYTRLLKGIRHVNLWGYLGT